jgi:signal transduction histidine kinase
VKNDKDSVRVEVADRGIGISEEFRGQVFEQFSQADIGNQRKVQGTGLGLSISKAIVEQHGGKIDFRDNAGPGTTFFFTLPTAIETPG